MVIAHFSTFVVWGYVIARRTKNSGDIKWHKAPWSKWHWNDTLQGYSTRTTNHPNREIFFSCFNAFSIFRMFRIQYSYASRSISRSLFCSDRFDSCSLCTALHEGEQSLSMSRLIPTAFLGECWKDRLYYPHGSSQTCCWFLCKYHIYIDISTIAKYATIIISNDNINSPYTDRQLASCTAASACWTNSGAMSWTWELNAKCLEISSIYNHRDCEKFNMKHLMIIILCHATSCYARNGLCHS